MTAPSEVMELLISRIARVMAVDPTSVSGESRFDDDLHADSLDLVEVVEGVERDLAERGQQAALSDEELLGLRTVAEAAERIAASTTAIGKGEDG